MTSQESRDALVRDITAAVEGTLAPRLAAAFAPLTEAVLTLQRNQHGIVEAINGLQRGQDTLQRGQDILQRGQETLTIAVDKLTERMERVEGRVESLADVIGRMQQVQQTLVERVERLHTERLVHIESRLAALETRMTGNDR